MRPETPSGKAHLEELLAAIAMFGLALETAESWGGLLAQRLSTGARLLAAGNGGSAAQAQHLTAELVGRYRNERRPLSAICLSAETSSLTAIINDYPADELFARQVEAHGRAGDVLVLMSTSGRSPNVLAAAERGRRYGLTVLAFTGPGPNPLAAAADEALCVSSQFTATVQELHLVGLHLVCASLDRELARLACSGADGLEGTAPRMLQQQAAHGHMADTSPGGHA
ncbi:MAG: SIS domain-containing protein [Nocardioidaceae bacterium]|nr:SIS domain-containing protein [Nocardioidaceae bacterium]